MILRPKTEREIIAAITAAPTLPFVLPAWAYNPQGRAIVLVDGFQIDLQRHLHNIMIRPLAIDERMYQRGPKGNINPHLFIVRGPRDAEPKVSRHNSTKTHCPAGHKYTKSNTYLDPSGRRRCRQCKRDNQRAYTRRRKERS